MLEKQSKMYRFHLQFASTPSTSDACNMPPRPASPPTSSPRNQSAAETYCITGWRATAMDGAPSAAKG